MASNENVAHAWAHNRNDSSSNMRSTHYGDAELGMITYLNSYSTTIGIKFADLAVMPWRDGWSNTTRRHLSHAYRALSCPIINIDIFDRGYASCDMTGRLDLADVRRLLIDGLIDKVKTIDDEWPTTSLSLRPAATQAVVEALDIMAELIAPKASDNPPLTIDWLYRFGKPTAEQRREMCKTLKFYGSYRGMLDEIWAEVAEQTRIRDEQEAKRLESLYNYSCPEFRDWQNNNRDDCPSHYKNSGHAFMRVETPNSINHAAVIKTSLGVKFPLDDLRKALRVYDRLDNGDGTYQPWKRNGEQVLIGGFHLDSITTTGSAVAGCHRVNHREIKRLRSLLSTVGLL